MQKFRIYNKFVMVKNTKFFSDLKKLLILLGNIFDLNRGLKYEILCNFT